jgi:hypothetical protein
VVHTLHSAQNVACILHVSLLGVYTCRSGVFTTEKIHYVFLFVKVISF